MDRITSDHTALFYLSFVNFKYRHYFAILKIKKIIFGILDHFFLMNIEKRGNPK